MTKIEAAAKTFEHKAQGEDIRHGNTFEFSYHRPARVTIGANFDNRYRPTGVRADGNFDARFTKTTQLQ